MRAPRRTLLTAAAVLAAVAAPAVATAPADGVQAFGRVAPGAPRLLVTFADTPAGATVRRRLAGLGALRAVAPEAGVWGLRPRGGVTRDAVLRRPRVRAAEWAQVMHSLDRPQPPPPRPLTPVAPFTDTLLARQWSHAADGWSPEDTAPHPRPIIAILDSGLDLTHPEWSGDNAAAVVGGRSVIAGRNPADIQDWGRTGHGTHVAGIAAAPADGQGVVGVAPASSDAPIMPVQVADRLGQFADDDLMAGIRWAVSNGAKVVNISAGGTGSSVAFQRVVYWATRQGAVITAAVGNEGDSDNPRLYPAAYARVLGVGAQCGPARSPDCPAPYGVARFSQQNDTVDLIAPGVDILSSVPAAVVEDEITPGYAYRDGTSMAAPYVAGVIALLQAANGNTLTPFQVVRQLERTADDLGPRGRDDRSGWGVVNIARALTTPVPPDDPGEVNDDIRYLAGATDLAVRAGAPLTVEGDVDAADDPDDVYPVQVHRGQRVRVVLTSDTGSQSLYVWGPATRTVSRRAGNYRRNVLGLAQRPGHRQVLVLRPARSGRIFVDVGARRGATSYRLRVTVSP